MSVKRELALAAWIAVTLVPFSHSEAQRTIPLAIERCSRDVITGELVDALLYSQPLNTETRNAVRKRLLELNPCDDKDLAAAVAILTTDAGLTAQQALVARGVLKGLVSEGTPPAQFLPGATASATDDRVYTSAELFRLQARWFTARILTATAASNVDSTENRDSAAVVANNQVRIRTAQVASLIQDGGPIVVTLAAQHAWRTKSGVHLETAVNVTGSKAGTLRFSETTLLGGSAEVRIGIDVGTPGTFSSASFVATARYGRRETKGVLVTGIDASRLSYSQIVLEGRALRSKVPVGVAFNFVDQVRLRPYAAKVQFFGTAGL